MYACKMLQVQLRFISVVNSDSFHTTLLSFPSHSKQQQKDVVNDWLKPNLFRIDSWQTSEMTNWFSIDSAFWLKEYFDPKICLLLIQMFLLVN